MEIDKKLIIWLRFFQAYKNFWLEAYFSKSLSKKLDDPPKNMHVDFWGPVMTHTAEIPGPQKSTCVFFGGSSNLLQRDFE